VKRLHFGLLVSLAAIGVALAIERRPLGVFRSVGTREAVTPRARLADLALPGAALIGTVDLGELRASALGRALLRELTQWALGRAPGPSCADDVLAAAERFAFVIPADGSASPRASELGLIAEGDFREERVLSCARELLRARKAEPVSARIASFSTLRDRKGGGELGIRAGGPLIVSGGNYFRDLLDRAEGALISNAGPREALHLSLRGELGPAPLLLTWVLPPGWLESWLEDRNVSASPLSAVRALAVRGEIEGSLRLRATIVAADATSSQQIAAFLASARHEFAAELEEMLGARGAESLGLTQKAERVDLTLELATPLDALQRLAAPSAPSSSSHPLGSADPEQTQPNPKNPAGRRAQQQP
jgi:hypothetical protein